MSAALPLNRKTVVERPGGGGISVLAALLLWKRSVNTDCQSGLSLQAFVSGERKHVGIVRYEQKADSSSG